MKPGAKDAKFAETSFKPPLSPIGSRVVPYQHIQRYKFLLVHIWGRLDRVYDRDQNLVSHRPLLSASQLYAGLLFVLLPSRCRCWHHCNAAHSAAEPDGRKRARSALAPTVAKKPRGRPPLGMEWNEALGQYVPAGADANSMLKYLSRAAKPTP
jgi:hypothetical protein